VLEWAVKLKPDLIVMGTHGRRGAKRFFLGSVTEAVVRRAACPVLGNVSDLLMLRGKAIIVD
jgi:nucleotide-binding universal stress UspA family protein